MNYRPCRYDAMKLSPCSCGCRQWIQPGTSKDLICYAVDPDGYMVMDKKKIYLRACVGL